MTYIYLITTFEKMNGKCEYGYLDVGDRRSDGWFPTFEGAERRVKNYTGDLWETCYDYAVIENIKEGLYQYDFHPTWYKYYKPTSGYIKCEQPDFVNPKGGVSMIGYAIG